jgi:uncharacterized protein DUF4926
MEVILLTELQTVALTRDIPEHGLVAGDVGTVVHVYADDKALEVEFARADGQTIAVLTLTSSDVRSLDADLLHARRLAS